MKLKKIFIALTLLCSFLGLVLVPVTAFGQSKDEVCQGIGLTSSGGGCDSGGGSSVDNILKLSLNILSVAIGIVAVIMIMLGGFRYVTSGGDSGKISSAKDTILYAIVGLVIVGLAQIIVKFVLSKVK